MNECCDYGRLRAKLACSLHIVSSHSLKIVNSVCMMDWQPVQEDYYGIKIMAGLDGFK